MDNGIEELAANDRDEQSLDIEGQSMHHRRAMRAAATGANRQRNTALWWRQTAAGEGEHLTLASVGGTVL